MGLKAAGLSCFRLLAGADARIALAGEVPVPEAASIDLGLSRVAADLLRGVALGVGRYQERLPYVAAQQLPTRSCCASHIHERESSRSEGSDLHAISGGLADSRQRLFMGGVPRASRRSQLRP